MEKWRSVVSKVINFGFYKMPGSSSLSAELLLLKEQIVQRSELFAVHIS